MLKYKADRKSLAFIAVAIVLRVLAWVFAQPVDWWLVFPLAGLTFCVLTIKHNHAHQRIFGQRRANQVLDVLIAWLTGTTATGMITIHVINHHRELNQEADWGTTHVVDHRWEIQNLVMYIPIFIGRYLKGQRALFQQKKYQKLKKAEFRENGVLLVIYATLFSIKPVSTLLFVVTINLMAQFILLMFNYIQHNGCDERSTYNHSINLTGKVMNWFVFNSGFHTIHHRYPNLHWTLLPAKHQELIAPYIDPRLNHPNFLKSFWRHYLVPGHKIGLKSYSTTLKSA